MHFHAKFLICELVEIVNTNQRRTYQIFFNYMVLKMALYLVSKKRNIFLFSFEKYFRLFEVKKMIFKK